VDFHEEKTVNSSQEPLQHYQQQFVDFLLEASALTFGDFVTKSGRETPYFVNTGKFNSGKHIARLGSFYAEHIISSGVSTATSIFGPAYKGIPLCVAAASALYSNHRCEIGYTFNRKEEKDHGDKGTFVGHPLQEGDSVVIVEDVITAGTTLREIVPILQNQFGVTVSGVIISVDRCERGTSNRSAVEEVTSDLQVEIYPIVTIHEILAYLKTLEDERKLSEEMQQKILEYLKQYGA
jgi:orotate phosphoribosyltransferase